MFSEKYVKIAFLFFQKMNFKAYIIVYIVKMLNHVKR